MTLETYSRLAEKEKLIQNSKRPPLKCGTVSPRLPVPDHIPRPPYVNSSRVPDFSKLPQIQDSHGIQCMRASGRLAAEILNYAGTLVKVSALLVSIYHSHCMIYTHFLCSNANR